MRLVEGAYKAAVGQKWVTPSEFWALTVPELWWLIEANTPEKVFGKKRRLTQSDVERIARDLEDDRIGSRRRASHRSLDGNGAVRAGSKEG